MRTATDRKGRLVYSAAHICINYFSIPFIRRFVDTELGTLPLHVAKKKIPCLDASGALVAPEKPNGVKLEMFIFDSFPCARALPGAQTTSARFGAVV